MNNPEARTTPECGPNMPPPYQDLHIYYVEGLPRTDLRSLGRDFIGNWEEGGCSFLFFRNPAGGKVDRLLADEPQLRLLDRFQMTYEEWQGGRVTTYKAGRLTVAPPWETPPEGELGTATLIRLDPGVVFGTGMHATTRDCLAALELACAQETYGTVLDLGTGSGLLALAAARLGCLRVLAVDLNPLAVRTARDNFRLNRLAHRMLAVQGKAEEFVDLNADLLIANIHYEVMTRLIASTGFLKKRRFILSGLMRSQAAAVAGQLKRMPVTLLRTWEQEGTWTTFFGSNDSIADGCGTAG
jgi:ribosomal protein L11 methyltransferase